MTGKSISNKAEIKGYTKACVRQGKDLNKISKDCVWKQVYVIETSLQVG